MDFLEQLKVALSQPLPGLEAQRIMAPEGRSLERHEGFQTAAVLIALFRKDNQWKFPLIQRVEDGYVHSGQVGLPGGRLETSETPIEGALREAGEEIGLKRESVRIIGQLTPLPIPVSKFLVHPVVGIIGEKPVWIVNPAEVQSLFEVSIDDIKNHNNIRTETWQFAKGPRRVPFFYLNGKKIWGATAMILSEFRVVLTSMIDV